MSAVVTSICIVSLNMLILVKEGFLSYLQEVYIKLLYNDMYLVEIGQKGLNK